MSFSLQGSGGDDWGLSASGSGNANPASSASASMAETNKQKNKSMKFDDARGTRELDDNDEDEEYGDIDEGREGSGNQVEFIQVPKGFVGDRDKFGTRAPERDRGGGIRGHGMMRERSGRGSVRGRNRRFESDGRANQTYRFQESDPRYGKYFKPSFVEDPWSRLRDR